MGLQACILLPHPLETLGQAKVRDLHVMPCSTKSFSSLSKTAGRRVRRAPLDPTGRGRQPLPANGLQHLLEADLLHVHAFSKLMDEFHVRPSVLGSICEADARICCFQRLIALGPLPKASWTEIDFSPSIPLYHDLS